MFLLSVMCLILFAISVYADGSVFHSVFVYLVYDRYNKLNKLDELTEMSSERGPDRAMPFRDESIP